MDRPAKPSRPPIPPEHQETLAWFFGRMLYHSRQLREAEEAHANTEPPITPAEPPPAR